MKRIFPKFVKFIAAAVTVTILFTGCVASNTIENKVIAYPATVMNVTVERSPKAVASLSPSITQMLLDLGYQDKIVGYPSDFAATSGTTSGGITVKEEQKIGTGLKPNFQQIGKLAPEIIFTNVPLTKAEMAKVSEIGMKVIVMPTVKTVDSLKARYVDLITAMEGKVKANHAGIPMASELQNNLDYINSQIPETKGSFLYVVSLDPIIATGDTFESDILSTVGTNLAADLTNYAASAEQVSAMNPDMIFFAAPLQAENIKKSEMFKNSKAVAENKLFAVDSTELSLHNNKVAEVIRKIAATVYTDKNFTAPAPPPPIEVKPIKWYIPFGG